MIEIEGFAHRGALADIVSRWMVNNPREGDVRRLKSVVNLNSYVARVWVDQLTREVLTRLHGQEPQPFLVRTKGQIKDFVVDHPTYTNPRVEEMRARYRRFPEDFYRDTPIDGGFYTTLVDGEPRLVGGTRIKRFRRIAEKGARRIVDFMLSRIRANADVLADERARNLGISRTQLYTPPATMAEEFTHAERRVIKSIKQGTIHSELPVLTLPDVVGVKLIVENADYRRLLDVIGSLPGCRILEEERHAGLYNAVNLKIGYRLDREQLLRQPPSGRYLRILAFRGFDPARVPGEYRRFIETAEDEVVVEVIVTSFEEYLESEIGRCMHEERILSQRSHPDYNGHLATNVQYLMGYILGLCRGSGKDEITDVPIKLWVKYMPDTIENIMRGIYLSDDLFFDVLPEAQPALELESA